jgi:hypothetical protein
VDSVERFFGQIGHTTAKRKSIPVEAAKTCPCNPADTWKSQLWTFAWLLETYRETPTEMAPLEIFRPSVMADSSSINSMAIMESTVSSRTGHHWTARLAILRADRHLAGGRVSIRK